MKVYTGKHISSSSIISRKYLTLQVTLKESKSPLKSPSVTLKEEPLLPTIPETLETSVEETKETKESKEIKERVVSQGKSSKAAANLNVKNVWFNFAAPPKTPISRKIDFTKMDWNLLSTVQIFL